MAETLDIIQLRTFVAIDECGGFGRAAVALHMSQPTVSQHVRSLEKRLQQPLVERDGRRARFTLAGEKLLAEARRILAVHDEALARLDVTRARTIVVGSTETAAEQILPELLGTLRRAFPDRQVQFHIDRSTKMTDAVTKGTIDLAVVLDTARPSPASRWASCPELVRVALLAAARTRRGRAAGGVHRAVRHATARAPGARRHRRRVDIAAESGSLEGVIAAARAGLGVAVLPTAGRAPAGLVVRRDFPDLGRIFVRLITRRGLEPDVEQAAMASLDGFFAVRRHIHARLGLTPGPSECPMDAVRGSLLDVRGSRARSMGSMTASPTLSRVDLGALTAAVAETAERYDRSGEFPAEGLAAVHRAGVFQAVIGARFGGDEVDAASSGDLRSPQAHRHGDPLGALIVANTLRPTSPRSTVTCGRPTCTSESSPRPRSVPSRSTPRAPNPSSARPPGEGSPPRRSGAPRAAGP